MKNYKIQKPKWGLDIYKESIYFFFVDIYFKGSHLGRTMITRVKYNNFDNGDLITIDSSSLLEGYKESKKTFDSMYRADV